MTDDDRQLLAYSTGRMPAAEAAAFARRLAAEPELAARHRRLAAAWDRLELPPPAPAPPGFAAAVRRRLEERPERAGHAAFVAPLARAAALAAGLVLGIGLGTAVVGPAAPAAAPADQAGAAVAAALGEEPGSLAELYWLALDEGATAEVVPAGEAR